MIKDKTDDYERRQYEARQEWSNPKREVKGDPAFAAPYKSDALGRDLNMIADGVHQARERSAELNKKVDELLAEQQKHLKTLQGGGKYPDGNPKTALGIAKPGAYYTPDIPHLEYSMAHMQGAFKYGPFNWRDDPVSISTYYEAAGRHMALFKAGQRNASDTGIHHLAHAMCCLSIIIDAEAHGTLIDDRYFPRIDAISQNPDQILETYIESAQPRLKAIREKWYGYAEKQAQAKSDDKFGAGPIPNEPKLSLFAQEMRDYPMRAIGRSCKVLPDGKHGKIIGAEDTYWIIQFGDGSKEKVHFFFIEVDHGR